MLIAFTVSLLILASSCVLPADVNECEAEPCKNGGICTDLVANYSCECPGEFMGRNCQQSKYSMALKLDFLIRKIYSGWGFISPNILSATVIAVR